MKYINIKSIIYVVVFLNKILIFIFRIWFFFSEVSVISTYNIQLYVIIKYFIKLEVLNVVLLYSRPALVLRAFFESLDLGLGGLRPQH